MGTEPDTYSYTRYLEAKQSVDERALHPRVWDRFIDDVGERSSLRIFEMGGGTGATALRIIDALRTRSVKSLQYEIVDLRAENIAAARSHLPEWGRQNGFEIREDADPIILRHPKLEASVDLRVGDALAGGRAPREPYDAIVAQAVLDIVPLPQTLSRFQAWSDEDTLWYFPIHFNGVTAFEPVLDSVLDAKIEELYHQSMNDGEGRGGAATGRRLLQRIQDVGATLLDAGGSDWIVTPLPDQHGYPQKEDYFLYHILSFIDKELRDHSSLDSSKFTAWLSARKEHIRKGELTFLVHNIDVIARA